MPNYLDFCYKIKQRDNWDKILFSPTVRSKLIREGYRINVEFEKEETIEQAKDILQKAGVVFEDKRATSFSPTVEPGQRTLRVTHQLSVCNLRKMWAKEFAKSPLAQSLKKQSERR